jgi:hypothetical protein
MEETNKRVARRKTRLNMQERIPLLTGFEFTVRVLSTQRRRDAEKTYLILVLRVSLRLCVNKTVRSSGTPGSRDKLDQ